MALEQLAKLAIEIAFNPNTSLAVSKGQAVDPFSAKKTREAELAAEKAARDAERAEQAASLQLFQDRARAKRLSFAAKRESAAEAAARSAAIVPPLGGLSGALLGPSAGPLGPVSGTLGGRMGLL